MHSDEILQLDVATFRIERRAKTGEGHVRPAGPAHHGPAAPLVGGVPRSARRPSSRVAPDDKRLYVACNYGNSLQVWDAATLTRMKRVPVGKGAYNVEPSPDGKLVLVTNKKEQSVSLVDAAKLTEIARDPHQQEDRARHRLLAGQPPRLHFLRIDRRRSGRRGCDRSRRAESSSAASRFPASPPASPFFSRRPLTQGTDPHGLTRSITTLDGAEVLHRAKRFFAERVPLNAAYPEKEGPDTS